MPSLQALVLELVGDVQGLLDLEEFKVGLIAALLRVLASDWVSLNEFGPRRGEVSALVVPELPQLILERFPLYAHENPLLDHQTRSQMGAARRISDMISPADFHALPLYREVYAPIGLEYQMAFTLPHAPPRVLGVALSRRRRDFSDEERDLVNLARPFLIQGYRNAVAYSSLAGGPDVARLQPALEAAGLAPRQSATVRLLALGCSNAAIAAELEISVRTVHKHLQHAYSRLGVTDRSAAAALAWELAAAR
jgi:DNA-binding CsgD family transcriptional regulator